MHCLLVGNGLNRLSLQLDWGGLLKRLATDLGVETRVQRFDDKPFSLLFEELCAYVGGRSRDAEHAIKETIAALLANIPPHPLHAQLTNLFDVILTTNYDYTLENVIAGPLFQRSPLAPESRYSLFRRALAGKKEVWHIHGEVYVPDTIVLGYDHYTGYVQKIRNYLTDGLQPGNRSDPVRSPLKSGIRDFEHRAGGTPRYSWVDHFLRDHLHIVGLGLDFTESDLWWLLVHKRRRQSQTGYTFYYTVSIGEPGDGKDESRLSALRSFGMEVISVNAADYLEGYGLLIDEIARNIAQHPQLREDRAAVTISREDTQELLQDTEFQKAARNQLQLGLKLTHRTKKKRRAG